MSVIQKGGIIGKHTVTRLRYGTAGTYVDGLYTPPTATQTEIYASVQPPNRMGSERLVQELTGQRTQDILCAIVEPDTLRCVDEAAGIRADRVVHLGKTYEVRFINRWVTGQVNMHDTAYIVRLDDKVTDSDQL
jgi:hypothetical protein